MLKDSTRKLIRQAIIIFLIGIILGFVLGWMFL